MSFFARGTAPMRAVHWLRSLSFIEETDASSFIGVTAEIPATNLRVPPAAAGATVRSYRDLTHLAATLLDPVA